MAITDSEDNTTFWKAVPAHGDEGRPGVALLDDKDIQQDFHEGMLLIHGAREAGGYYEPASSIRCRRIKGRSPELALYIRPEEPVTETSVAWFALSDEVWRRQRNR